MFGLQQVVCGRGSRGDTGELHRAYAVACELRALGRWDGRGRIVIHAPHETHRRLALTPVLDMRAPEPGALPVKLHAGTAQLRPGVDYELLGD
jgi:hypothetical protein